MLTLPFLSSDGHRHPDDSGAEHAAAPLPAAHLPGLPRRGPVHPAHRRQRHHAGASPGGGGGSSPARAPAAGARHCAAARRGHPDTGGLPTPGPGRDAGPRAFLLLVGEAAGFWQLLHSRVPPVTASQTCFRCQAGLRGGGSDCSAIAPCDQTGSFETAGQAGRGARACGAVSVSRWRTVRRQPRSRGPPGRGR